MRLKSRLIIWNMKSKGSRMLPTSPSGKIKLSWILKPLFPPMTVWKINKRSKVKLIIFVTVSSLQMNDILLYTTPFPPGQYKLNNVLSLAGTRVRNRMLFVDCWISHRGKVLLTSSNQFVNLCC